MGGRVTVMGGVSYLGEIEPVVCIEVRPQPRMCGKTRMLVGVAATDSNMFHPTVVVDVSCPLLFGEASFDAGRHSFLVPFDTIEEIMLVVSYVMRRAGIMSEYYDYGIVVDRGDDGGPVLHVVAALGYRYGIEGRDDAREVAEKIEGAARRAMCR